MIEQSDLIVYGLGGVAGTGIVAWLIKFLVVTAFSTKADASKIQVSEDFTTRLYEEIKRLEGIIKEQSNRIDLLDKKLNDLRDLELSDLGDIAQIDAIIEAHCLLHPTCENNQRIARIIDRIKGRRSKS